MQPITEKNKLELFGYVITTTIGGKTFYLGNNNGFVKSFAAAIKIDSYDDAKFVMDNIVNKWGIDKNSVEIKGIMLLSEP